MTSYSTPSCPVEVPKTGVRFRHSVRHRPRRTIQLDSRLRVVSFCAALVRKEAVDLSTCTLRAENPLTSKASDVVGNGCVVTIQAPRDLPNPDSRILADLLDEGFLQGAEGLVAPQGHVAVRVVPAVMATLLRMDEPLSLKDLQMVRRDAIPKPNGITDFRKRGSRFALDRLVQQEAHLPLENRFPEEARVLKTQESRRDKHDNGARGCRGSPREWGCAGAARDSLHADGERGTAPRPHGHRSRFGRGVGDLDPDIVDAGGQPVEHQRRTVPGDARLHGRRQLVSQHELQGGAARRLGRERNFAPRLARDRSENRLQTSVQSSIHPGEEHRVVRACGEALNLSQVRRLACQGDVEGRVFEALAVVRGDRYIDGARIVWVGGSAGYRP